MLTIHGKGGHGQVVADAFCDGRAHRTVQFTDDSEGTRPKSGVYYIAGIGDNHARKEIGGTARVVHPTAVIAKDVFLGPGTYVGAKAVINPGAHIGRGVIINTGAIVEHHCVVGDYAHIAPGAVLCGKVSVGEGCFIGASSVVKQGIQIAPWVTVGCGAAVVSDLEEPGVYMGVPARKGG